MANLSIYQNSWIDLVFEDRNKEYGAYQLRKENVRTTIFALFYAFIFVVAAMCLPLIFNFLQGNKADAAHVNDIPKMPTVVIFSPKKPEIPKKAFVPPSKIPASKSAVKPTLHNPIIVDRTNESPTVPKKSEPTIGTEPSVTDSSETSSATTSTDSGTFEAPSKIGTSTIVNRNELDKSPEFPGGIKVFLNYVGTNFKTPELDTEQTVKVYVSFIVEIDGTMSHIQVENDPGFGLKNEAIRVLKSVKAKWQAGQKDGQKVRTLYNLPISVELK